MVHNAPCPSCGFHTLPDAYGSFDICNVCGWEDCAVQFGNPLDVNGPNRRSLADYQRESVRRWPLSVTSLECGGEVVVRDPRWRPLAENEIEAYRESTSDGRELAHAAVWTVDDAYWNRNGK